MSVHVIRGPAGSQKNAWVKENHPQAMIADATLIWAAVTQTERGPNGKYPERTLDAKTRAALYLKSTLVTFAAREDLDLWVSTSNSSPHAVERVRERVMDAGGRFGQVKTLDPGREIIEARLSDRDGVLSDECRTAVDRWYSR